MKERGRKRHINFLVIQWLRLHTPNAEGPGINPGQETRSCMPQLRVQILQLKDCTSCMPHLRQAELNKYFVNILIKKKESVLLCRGHRLDPRSRS